MSAGTRGAALDAIVEACGGYILGTGPRRGTDNRVIAYADGGEWDCVRMLDRRTLARLVGAGMAARMRAPGAALPARARGVPASPDLLAHAIAERGHGPYGMSADDACVWYVARVLAVLEDVDTRERPDPLDELPAWCRDWLNRLVCPAKREYATAAALSVYVDAAWTPDDLGRSWECKVWARLGRRDVAETARRDRRRQVTR